MEDQSGQPDQGSQSPSNSERRRSKSKAKVWEQFTPVITGWKIERAECKHCQKSFRGKSSRGTSHLRRHLKVCPAQPTRSQLQPQPSPPHPDASVENSMELDKDKFWGFFRKALVYNLCPSPLTSSKNTMRFLAGICPVPNVLSQAVIEGEFKNIFETGKMKLKEEIGHALGGGFLTLARWNLDSKCFVCVTAHFIDRDWNMSRKIIGCKFAAVKEVSEADYFLMFSSSQHYPSVEVWDDDEDYVTADAEDIVVKVVKDWNLEGKISGICLHKSLKDTGRFGDLLKALTAQNYILDRYRLLMLPCIIDSLHDLLQCRSTFVKTTRDWLKYMKGSQQRRDKYNEILAQLQMNRPCFGSKKWYMIFYLLEVALQFNRELPNPEQQDSLLYLSKPSPNEIRDAELFCRIARRIYLTITEITSPRNVTLNLHFHVIWSLRIVLLVYSRNTNADHIIDVKEMQVKVDELWRKWYLWLSLAVVLDPRHKFRFIDSCFKKAFRNDAKRYICAVLGKMYDLFLQYSCCMDKETNDSLNQRRNDLQLDIHESITGQDTDLNYMDELSELTGYLESEQIPQNADFDILKWWKDNAFVYPTLAKLACDILPMSGCAFSAESAFDESDILVSLFNQKMSPEKVEALICTQDWMVSSSELSYENSGKRTTPT